MREAEKSKHFIEKKKLFCCRYKVATEDVETTKKKIRKKNYFVRQSYNLFIIAHELMITDLHKLRNALNK